MAYSLRDHIAVWLAKTKDLAPIGFFIFVVTPAFGWFTSYFWTFLLCALRYKHVALPAAGSFVLVYGHTIAMFTIHEEYRAAVLAYQPKSDGYARILYPLAGSMGGLAISAFSYEIAFRREYGPCELGDWTGWTTECSQDEAMLRTRLVTFKGAQVTCDAHLSETRHCSVDCDVHPWDTWSSCEAASGRKHHERSVRTWPTKSGKECPPLDESVPCAVDCTLSQWSTWSSCSASCGGGTCSRSRSVLIPTKNGGTPCGPTYESVECNKVPCFVLHLNDTLQRDCSIAKASELHTVLITLLAAGVERVDDLCLLEHAQLQPSLSSSGPIANSVVKMLPDGAGAYDPSAVAMLPVTQKKLLQCICNVLCKSLGSPLCTQTQQKVDQLQREDSLVEWIQGSCDVTVGTKEVVDALQALGVEKLQDLRHTTDAMVDGLAGVSPVRRQKMRACLRAFHEKEL